MPNITLKVPQKTIDAYVEAYGYKDTVVNPDYDPEEEGSEPHIKNPVSKADYFKMKIGDQIMVVAMNHDEEKEKKANADTRKAEYKVE